MIFFGRQTYSKVSPFYSQKVSAQDFDLKKPLKSEYINLYVSVYENSDDIAMTANPDKVYSTTNQKNDSAKKEQRGYKVRT